MKHILITLLGFLVPTISQGSDYVTFLKKQFTAKDGTKLNYRIQYPLAYDDNKDYPLLIFLHGAGERGQDNEAQLVHGGDLLSSWDIRSELNVIIIAPQCPDGDTWSPYQGMGGREERFFQKNATPTKTGNALQELADKFLNSGLIDRSRVYIAGLSMGGMGAFDMVLKNPHAFAAASPICGGTNLDRIAEFNGQTAFRVYHGAADSVVPASFSRDAVDALKKANIHVEYLEYPKVMHNSWDNAFAEPDFLSWMLSFSL